LVIEINAWYEIGLQRACGLLMLERSSFYYRSHSRDHRGLSMRIKELAMTRIRFGYLRLTVLLKREGWPVGKKLVYRLYRELKLQVRSKRRKKLASQQRGPPGDSAASQPTLVHGLCYRSIRRGAKIPRANDH
jgi:putative transposase